MEAENNIIQIKKDKPVQIFSKGHREIGVNVIKSPAKLTILTLLRDSEMEFDEIVENTGKSKSTISAHLKGLREEGIISFKFDDKDQRKKIFYINSRFLGEIDVPEPFELKEQKVDFLLENIINKDDSDAFEFSRLLFHTFRSTLIQEGININPILYEAGKKIGLVLYEQLKDEDFNTFVSNLQEFWIDYGLGEIEINTNDEFKIMLHDCFECILLPKTGMPTCYLAKGVLESIFTSFYKKDLNIIETMCNIMGDDTCVFVVEFLE